MSNKFSYQLLTAISHTMNIPYLCGKTLYQQGHPIPNTKRGKFKPSTRAKRK